MLGQHEARVETDSLDQQLLRTQSASVSNNVTEAKQQQCH